MVNATGAQYWPSTFTNWASGQPNDSQDGEDCVMYGWNGSLQWVDALCNQAFWCLCETDALDAGVVRVDAGLIVVLDDALVSSIS